MFALSMGAVKSYTNLRSCEGSHLHTYKGTPSRTDILELRQLFSPITKQFSVRVRVRPSLAFGFAEGVTSVVVLSVCGGGVGVVYGGNDNPGCCACVIKDAAH